MTATAARSLPVADSADSKTESPAYSYRFDSALLFAAQQHRNHWRQGRHEVIPYISHSLAVAALVSEAGGTETETIAALLHGVVETIGMGGGSGTKRTLAQIKARFGQEVAGILRECVEPDDIDDKYRFLSMLEKASAPALLVTAADKYHSSRRFVSTLIAEGEDAWRYLAGGRELGLQYYQDVLTVLQHRCVRDFRVRFQLEPILKRLGMVLLFLRNI